MPSRSDPPLVVYDDSIRQELHDRLGKVEGQLRGIGRMIDHQRPPEEVLQQLASIRSAVKSITKAVMRSYIVGCAAEAARSGDGALDTMLEMLLKFVKE
ncbi:MAG: metal-sensitive transcriptional regulator [Gemmataceae bacterium]|nr:metal-sensitive transcriptional regulator [Gemmata sp.]MDW8196470.1 metal-sensitive transcriptional regulator [Gemmataceae bacterium]